MQRIWQFFLKPTVVVVMGVAALAAFLLLGADTLQIGLIWAGVVLGLLGWLGSSCGQCVGHKRPRRRLS